ncbi:uncharacterized protein PAC_09348 [Phialocephala subalpina]|uniref:Uncharacterized protein n=1 Tax=Phialocephala subalpina TaxID=576137 RepID=A0A1L7X390_9HELO|nr:uncharacterized protein PAC_09348 [Phialocephala subalpina]
MSGRRNSGRRPSRSNSHSSRRSHSHQRPSNSGVHPGVPAHHLAAFEALNARMNNDNLALEQLERRSRRQSRGRNSDADEPEQPQRERCPSRGANPNAGEAAAAAAAAAVARNQAAAPPLARSLSQWSHQEEGAEQPAEHRDLEADLPNAVPKSYDVRDLARLLRANAGTAPARFAARLDITQQDIVCGNAPNNLASNSTAEIREYLEAWVGILDTVFFFGSLIRKGLEGGFSLYSKPGSRKQAIYNPER